MDVRQPSCNSDLIKQFLADQLGVEELAAFETHLDSCRACRREVEDGAADPSWWSAARECLASSGLNSVRPRSSGEDPFASDGILPRDCLPTDTLLVAIRPYLAPTDDPRMLGRVG